MMNSKKIQAQLEKEQTHIKNQIAELVENDPFSNPDHVIDNAAVDTDVREQETHQRIEAEIKTLNTRLSNIKIALDRLTKGQYGYCKRCNKTIPEKRLALIPESIYCVACESQIKG
ncbi:TraR/DksA C4-type zinc finger protein [Candidatus Woesebacteria bacterium]|nr:TraR/DksA C4-type zinc finger protein [Candidatus Woesebacteria bacterium]